MGEQNIDYNLSNKKHGIDIYFPYDSQERMIQKGFNISKVEGVMEDIFKGAVMGGNKEDKSKVN